MCSKRGRCTTCNGPGFVQSGVPDRYGPYCFSHFERKRACVKSAGHSRDWKLVVVEVGGSAQRARLWMLWLVLL